MSRESTSIRSRFIFENTPIRGVVTHLDDLWQEIKVQKEYPKEIEHLLGELLAAGVLLTSNLKLDGSLILQIQSQGALKLLVVEVSSDLTCRATARWDDALLKSNTGSSLKDLTGSTGQFVVTLQPSDGEAWQGIVAITGQSVSDMLMSYMMQSEQLPTFIHLACGEHSVGGLLLQRLPASEKTAQTDNDWETVVVLGQTLKDEELLELDSATILNRLFHEFDIRTFENESFQFACTCSVEKVSDMLKLIGGEEVGKTILEQGSIEISCDFCQKAYVFDEEDTTEIFGMNVVEAVRENKIQPN